MLSTIKLLIFLVLLVLETDSYIPAPMMAGVAAAIQRRFMSGCVFLLHVPSTKDLSPEETAMEMNLRKFLSQERVQIAARRLGTFNSTWAKLECSRNSPLNIIFSSTQAVQLTLLEFSTKQPLAGATWLLFLTVGKLNTFFNNIHIPFNCEFLVARRGTGSVSLSEVYRVAADMPLNEFYFGRWNDISGLSSIQTSIYKRRNNLQGIVINVVTGDDPPILTLEKNQSSVSGFFGRVWKILESKMNFRTNYTITSDLAKGKPTRKNDCSGMIGMLECGEVDVALGAFSTSSYPTANVKFSMPLLFTTYQMFIKKPAGRKADWDAFLMPFSTKLWLVLSSAILIISLYLTTFYKIGRLVGNEESGGPELYTFYDSILYVFGAFCQQGHDITPRSTSCRLVYITAYLTAIVLLAAYSAALISSLTVFRTNLPFTDLEGVLKDKTYKVGVVLDSEIYYTVSDPEDDGIFRDLYLKLMAPDPGNFPLNVLDGLRRVCNMKYAFMAIRESVLPLLDEVNCSIVSLPYKSYPISLAIAFTPTNPYREFISYRLRMLGDGGVLHRLRTKNWPYMGPVETKTSLVGVDLRAVAPLLVLLTSSVVVSVVILFIERGKYLLSNSSTKRYKTRLERNALRQESILKTATQDKSAYLHNYLSMEAASREDYAAISWLE